MSQLRIRQRNRDDIIRAICLDYQNDALKVPEIAAKNGVSERMVHTVARSNNLRRNRGNAKLELAEVPFEVRGITYTCPRCTFRALTKEGHEVCR